MHKNLQNLKQSAECNIVRYLGAIQERPRKLSDHQTSEERDPSAVPPEAPTHPQTLLLLPGRRETLHCIGLCEQWRTL